MQIIRLVSIACHLPGKLFSTWLCSSANSTANQREQLKFCAENFLELPEITGGILSVEIFN
jgi:hypothetical protein